MTFHLRNSITWPLTLHLYLPTLWSTEFTARRQWDREEKAQTLEPDRSKFEPGLCVNELEELAVLLPFSGL
jgi:hypothetical protein